MNRRGFLGGILAAACAPAIVRADSLMRIIPRETRLLSLDEITRDALRLMHEKASFINTIDRQYDREYERLAKFRTTEGQIITIQGVYRV